MTKCSKFTLCTSSKLFPFVFLVVPRTSLNIIRCIYNISPSQTAMYSGQCEIRGPTKMAIHDIQHGRYKSRDMFSAYYLQKHSHLSLLSAPIHEETSRDQRQNWISSSGENGKDKKETVHNLFGENVGL